MSMDIVVKGLVDLYAHRNYVCVQASQVASAVG